MEWHEIELNGSQTSEFPMRAVPGYEGMLSRPPNERGICSDYIGGIINDGTWGWLTRQHAEEATLLICALNNGQRIAQYTFWRESERKANQRGLRSIRCVEELFPAGRSGRLLLAVCIDTSPSQTQSYTKSFVAIYTPVCSQVLRYIELDGGLSARTMCFMDAYMCEKTAMQEFDGCLAVGTHTGNILFIDINAEHVERQRCRNVNLPDGEVYRASLLRIPFENNRNNHKLKRCRDQNKHLALELDLFGAEDARSGICSLLPISIISGFACGLQDGRIFIYNLLECKLVQDWGLPENELPTPVERLCCIVPPDDPKPCFYLCAIYNRRDCLMSSLYSINYSLSVLQADNVNVKLHQFQNASKRMCLFLDDGNCSIIGCDTASTFAFAGDNGTLLTTISWYSHTEQKNKLLLFDINQWYKDEMPSVPRPHETPNYLCGYILSGLHTGLSFQLDPRSIMHFISLQRQEEHSYPNSLSFDCSLLTITGCRQYTHVGVQRRFLNALYSQKASMFLNPQPYVREIMNIRLMPQFCDHNVNEVLSKGDMFEVILSVALEHRCIGLLNNCAQYCLDGSFLCNMLVSTNLTLPILTNWLVKRAVQIKDRCSELCQGIFDYGGYSLDERERSEFQQQNEQLYKLQQLQTLILKLGKSRLSPEQRQELQTTETSLITLYEYQRVLYWLIERGLLPEGNEGELPLEQRPLQRIRREYTQRRIAQTEKLYIDELLHHSGFVVPLKDQCLDYGVYPPLSLQSFMHLMLLPDAQLSHKLELIMYLLLDLDQLAIQQESSQLFKDFVLSFDMCKPVAKSVRSFWFLDRRNFKQSIIELYRGEGQNKDKDYEKWQMKKLIDMLLANGANMEAKRVLLHPPGCITAEQHLQILLANANIPEAFHHARLNDDEAGRPLLEHFFEHCIRTREYTVLASLCLREHEEQLVYRLLRQCKTRQTDSVQLILLLKRCKYIEAVSFMDEVAAEYQRGPNGDSLSEETHALLSAYRETMAPVTQTIAGTYLRIRDNLNGDHVLNTSPEPFSCQLAKQHASGQLSGIFQSSALSAHWATRYGNHEEHSLNSRNMPFLRNAAQASHQLPERRRLVRPKPHQYVEKRPLEWSQYNAAMQSLQPAKRRRMLGDQSAEGVSSFIRRFGAQMETQQKLEQEEEQQPPLQDDQLVAELLQPPAYLKFKVVSDAAKAVQESQRLQALQPLPPRPPAILKRQPSSERFMMTAKPPSRLSFKFMPPIPVHLDEGMEEDRMDEQADDSMGLSSDLTEQTEEDAKEQEEEEEVTESDDTDEIFMTFDEHPATPTPNLQLHLDHSIVSVSDSEYLSPVPSNQISFAEQCELLQLQLPLVMQPTGPQPRSSLNLGLGAGATSEEQCSSGFGSFATVQMGNTDSLQLNTFVPPVCSSKMCETQSQSQSQSQTQSVQHLSSAPSGMATHVRMSERTTICVDQDEPMSSVASPTLGLWAIPSSTFAASAAQTQHMPQTLQMLDTTLGMSSYDMTTLEPATVDPMDYIELDDEEEEEEQQQQQQQHLEDEQSSQSSSEEAAARETLSYQRISPSYSISSEISDLSSSELAISLPPRQNAPVYSIVVESTNSINASSRSPTSFLPSDTNVSQNSNSSPRPTQGAADGSNRTLYRANSLETVDDLDTTKGSLEEDDELDEEDDCVIALDGTEVRGYVPRPEPVVGCSSAELFAFKSQSHNVSANLDTASQQPCAVSQAATVNSDSIQTYTINLDSVDSVGEVELQLPSATGACVSEGDAGTSNDSVATAKQQIHETQTNKGMDLDLEIVEPAAEMSNETEVQLELEQQLNASRHTALPSETETDVDSDVEIDVESNPSLTLAPYDNEEKEQEDEEEHVPKEEEPVDKEEEQVDKEEDQVDKKQEVHKEERGDKKQQADKKEQADEKEQVDKMEMQANKKEQEADEEQQQTDKEEQQEDKEQQADKEEEQADKEEEQADKEEVQHKEEQQADTEEEPVLEYETEAVPNTRKLNLIVRLPRSTSKTPEPVRRSIRLRSDDLESPSCSTPSPLTAATRNRRRRSGSEVSEDLASTAVASSTPPISNVRGRPRLRSDDSSTSIASEDARASRVLRAGSMPTTSAVPVSTPKRRQRLMPKHLEVIEEDIESIPRTRSRTQLSQISSSPSIVSGSAVIALEDEEASTTAKRKLRSNSEPPADVKPPIKPKRQRKPSNEDQSQESVAAGTRNLRSRRSTPEVSEQKDASDVEKVLESHVPPKKRGRPKK